MIEIRNISKSFGDNKVLNDISCTFEQGVANLIIGASGSGKSVLTKCIVGLHEPDEGSVLFDDRDFLKMSFKERKSIRKELGFLFQGSALFDSLTVEENVKFPLRMLTKMSESEMQKRADFCLDRVNLPNAHNLLPAELSGGMMKRVGIARAISVRPKYLFCDEPNSGLDPLTATVIDNLIHEITLEDNMTTIVITHDMNSVLEIGDRIMFLYNGTNWWSGTKDNIMKTENKQVVEFVYSSKFMKNLRKEA